MAIYHLHAKVISRATGRSAVAAAAYRAASRLHDLRLDRDHDFSNKSGVVHSEILLPDGAPKRFLDRATLWNEVEAIEKRKDAQLAREVEFSIPREMTQAQGIALARDFVREQFVERGMVADLNVHWDIGEDGQAKPHAHVMLSTRRIEVRTGEAVHGRRDGIPHPERGGRGAYDITPDPGPDGAERGRRSTQAHDPSADRDPGDAAWHPAEALDAGEALAASGRTARLIAAARLRHEGLGLAQNQPSIGFGAKERSWNDKDLLLTWRERWASLANERLAELDLDVRIDHRSFAEQGIDLEPQNKIGPAGMRREERGEDAERVADHLEIARRNGERLLAEPHVALEALTRQQSTFTRQDLARFVDRHTADAEQFSAVMVRVAACPELVALGKDGYGRERFSTREMIGVEQRLEEASLAMGQSQGHAVPLAVRRAAMARDGLGDEQALAVGEVTKSRDLSVVVGYAGTGKSTMLGVARAAWEKAGYRVRGAALSGIAAEGLEAGSGIESRTLASLERAWARGFDLLERGDVLVVDEAGMVGSRQMERVLSVARGAGAKVVLVGDPEQLQAIEAGGAFRAVAERVGSVEITTVYRQREDWQQAATKELATGRTGEALGRYEAAGLVRGHDTLEEARAGVVAGWDEARQAAPEESQIMLAHRRVDVRALNEAARAIRREAGELGDDVLVPTVQGERVFADGERVYFLRNDRELGVKNGTLGTVRGITGSVEAGDLVLSVQLDGPGGTGRGRVVSVSVADYDALDHGYAATIHKSQGVTVDRAHVLATGSMDRHGAYVALSRHRESVSVHWGRDDLGDRDGLVRRLSRERLKDTTLDYPQVRDRDAGFARRRGLHVPESEIVVGREKTTSGPRQDRQAEAVRTPDLAPAQRKRGMFDGLDLSVRLGHRTSEKDVSAGMDAGSGKGESGAGREAPASPFAGLRLPRVQRAQVPAGLGGFVPGGDPLHQAVEQYARAVRDIGRMVEQDLPVLEHQKKAWLDASTALERLRPGAVIALETAVKHEPEIRQALYGLEGSARARRLVEGLEHEDRVRHSPELRAARFVKAWDGLSREQQGVALKELKRDAQLESLLRRKGHELGVRKGSTLDHGLQPQRTRSLSRSRGRDMDMGI
ncbi:Ti-type conjugative transfer relaxase TraA [Komagataeibacter oboediens]|uniref:Ti-type conjugative transfer relaxase TraA n=1 Tax=Komagataeibacter oboediens TaxID=65958 RepID=A0A318QMH5_9PROT|nr:Ti-type conjugative transfer relaxase TraA [Komagataeibacter oboediens]PYD79194.1 Ti-type conjugative transfer relaxase TraA [Komagataeibacter oboediens]